MNAYLFVRKLALSTKYPWSLFGLLYLSAAFGSTFFSRYVFKNLFEIQNVSTWYISFFIGLIALFLVALWTILMEYKYEELKK